MTIVIVDSLQTVECTLFTANYSVSRDNSTEEFLLLKTLLVTCGIDPAVL